MGKRLSYEYSFRWEKKASIIASCFCSIVFFVITIVIFVYTPLKWYHGLISFAVAFASIIDAIWHNKCKNVHYDLDFIYISDYKEEKRYCINNLLVLKHFSDKYYILEIKNEQGLVDKIYVYVYPYGKLFLTKEAKELIKLAKTAKVKNLFNLK